MFFLLMDGERLLERPPYCLPLQNRDKQRMQARLTSVRRATFKGSAVIGILQGGPGGAAFAAVGIQAPVFRGTIITVLSIVPGVGTALVWVPAAVILAAGGHYPRAAALAGFCAVIVGSIDNFVRPRLVGKDTEMHEPLILFGTLGGIISGSIVSALFVTVWEICAEFFKEYLPEVRPAASDGPSDGEEDASRLLLARDSPEDESA